MIDHFRSAIASRYAESQLVVDYNGLSSCRRIYIRVIMGDGDFLVASVDLLTDSIME